MDKATTVSLIFLHLKKLKNDNLENKNYLILCGGRSMNALFTHPSTREQNIIKQLFI